MQKDKNDRESKDEQKKSEEEIDRELEQTFPASDPPSYSSPGNDKVDEKQEDERSERTD